MDTLGLRLWALKASERGLETGLPDPGLRLHGFTTKNAEGHLHGSTPKALACMSACVHTKAHTWG